MSPETLKLLAAVINQMCKSRTFRVIAVVVLIVIFYSPIFTIVAIAGVASTPTAIFGWGKNTKDYSNGDKKTLSQYNTMQKDFKSAMDDAHKNLLDTIQQDISANGYVAQGTAQNQAYVGGRSLFAVSAVAKARLSVSTTAAGGISGELRQQLLADVGRLAGRDDAIVAAIQNDTTQDQMENDVATDMEGHGKSPQAITKVLNAMDSDFSSSTASSPPSPSGGNAAPSGGNTQTPPPSPTPPVNQTPKDTYTISDQYSNASLIAAADFAISAYSLKQGETASASGFQKAVQKGAASYLTYTKVSKQNADGSRLFTYAVTFDPTAGSRVFDLSADDSSHVSQLSVNLQLLVAKLEGKASDATITAGVDNNGMGVSDSLIVFIEKWEGFMPNWYNDGYGTQTIGYGHIEALPPGFATPLTTISADELLRTDLTSYIASVQAEFAGVNLKQNQINALVSLCYNLGPNIWSKASLTNDIKSQAPADVIQRDFEALDHVKGAESAGLLNRRMAEYQVFENDVYSY